MQLATIARPYSVALFKQALKENAPSQLDKWADFLAFFSEVVADSQIKTLADSPKCSNDALIDVLLALCKKASKSQQNLVKLLVKNKRLAVVAEIATQFEKLKHAYEKTLKVEVRSAQKLTAEESEDLAAALEKKLGSQVELEQVIDEDLLGGVVIRAGDMVINSSVQGRLEQFANTLVL